RSTSRTRLFEGFVSAIAAITVKPSKGGGTGCAASFVVAPLSFHHAFQASRYFVRAALSSPGSDWGAVVPATRWRISSACHRPPRARRGAGRQGGRPAPARPPGRPAGRGPPPRAAAGRGGWG